MNLRKTCKKLIIASSIASSIAIASIVINPQLVKADTIENYNNQTYIELKSTSLGVVKPCDYLNVRLGASTKHSIVTKVYTNDTVSILEKTSNGWIKIQTSTGHQGWVNEKYISAIENNPGDVAQDNIREQKINNVISVAKSQIGKPYKWGASGPNAFDCSGLTSYSYQNGADVKISRTSTSQSKDGYKVDRSNLQPGDLVFFNTSGKGISHVGIYIGNSNFIHSPSSGKNVKTDSINSSYYSQKFVTARRIIK